jgi:parallel beta-helix repeat protein
MRRVPLVMAATLGVAVLVVVGWLTALVAVPTPVHAAELCAYAYGSIQAAINAADDGDTVLVTYGTYKETLLVTEDITLQGGWDKDCKEQLQTDPSYTIIDGDASGSVVSVTEGSEATLESLTLTNGQSDKGGGLYVLSASPTLSNVVVTGNVITSTVAQWTHGGGVYVSSGTITLVETDITHNTAYGGTTGARGGGLATCDGSVVLRATRIMSNVNGASTRLDGGGMWVDHGDQVTVEGTENEISYNEATYGGGVYMWADSDLQGLLILDNYAASYGGGIFIAPRAVVIPGRIANNYIIGNEALLEAASVRAPDGGVEIANNTIVGDFSGTGAGIYLLDDSGEGSEITNNIVVSHAVGIELYSGASVVLTSNDAFSNTTNYLGVSAGTGDISVDPEFVDPGNDDYHLDADSPCIDAGTGVDGLHFDYDGDLRTGTLLDIGADELHTEPFFVPLTMRGYGP